MVVERWPAGARAAVVLTDHADRTDPDALRAVLWGSSDPRAEGGIGAGLLGRGLRITRTFFVHARRGALDDPEIRLLAEDLAGAGSEVALHSVTPERDDRDAVSAGLAGRGALASAHLGRPPALHELRGGVGARGRYRRAVRRSATSS